MGIHHPPFCHIRYNISKENQSAPEEQENRVLDLQTEQHELGQAYTDLYEAVGDLKRRHDLHPCTVHPRDGLTLRKESERETVADLVKRFRSLPNDQQRKLPALLNSLAQLEVVIGELEASQNDFQEVAQIVSDPRAQAEANYNVYRAALEREDYDQALKALQSAVTLDAASFEPFPWNRFEPVQILSADGFGVVFRCREIPNDASVIVRALRLDSLDRDPQIVLRDLMEVQELDHPSLIQIKEIGLVNADQTRPFLVLEHFEGETLTEVIRSQGTLNPDEWLQICWPILRALQALHLRGLLHRSLRPDAVVLRRELDEESRPVWRVKLADATLSLRRALIHASSSSIQAQPNTCVGRTVAGSIRFQPSEVVSRPKGQVWVGPHSDLYSLGKIGLLVLTGQSDPDPGDRLKLPDEWARILDQATAWIIQHRFSDTTLMIDRVNTLAGESAISRIEKRMYASVLADYSAILDADPTNLPALMNRASAHVRRGDHEKALEDFSRALEMKPNDANIYRRRALCHSRLNRTDAAIADYTEALRLDPRNVEALASRGLAWSLKDEYLRAIADYSEALKIHPRDELLLYNRGNAHFLLGDLAQALADYSAVIRLNPQHLWALSNRGKTHGLRGDHAKAIVDYTSYLQIDPGNVKIRLDRAHAYTELNQYDRAIDDYTEAIRLQPEAGIYMDRGLAHANRDQMAEAIADFTEAIRIKPDYGSAYMFRGHARASLVTDDNFQEALADLDESIRLNPESAVAWYNRGNLRIRMGDRDLAVADYNKALEINPTYYSARFNRANTLAEVNQFAEAIADYTLLIEHNPSDPACYTNRGNARNSLGLFDQALADYGKAIELDPKDGMIRCNRANTLARIGRFEEALEDLEEGIRLDPLRPRSFLQRSRLLASLQQLDRARTDIETAIRLSPQSARGYHARANLLVRMGNPAEALADYNKAIELAADFALAYYHRANLHASLGRDDLARQDYDRVIHLHSSQTEAYNNRGLCLQRLGESELALADFQQAAVPSTSIPPCWNAFFNRSLLLMELGKLTEAVSDLDQLLFHQPKDVEGLLLRAVLQNRLGNRNQALAYCRAALLLQSQLTRVLHHLAWLVLQEKERHPQSTLEAEQLAREATPSGESPAPALLEVQAGALACLGRFSDAVTLVRQAMQQVGPDDSVRLLECLNSYESGQMVPVPPPPLPSPRPSDNREM